MLYTTNERFSIAPVAFTLPPIKPPIPKIYFGLIKITQQKSSHALKILRGLRGLHFVATQNSTKSHTAKQTQTIKPTIINV